MIADFLSPKLAQLHFVDPTLTEYRVITQVNKKDFEEFLSLGYGHKVKMREDNVLCYSQLFREFDNPELYKLISHYMAEPSTNENVLEKIRLRELHKEKCQKELEFAGSQFYQIPIEQLRRADTNLLYSILSQSSLKIESEDLLFSFLVDRFSTEPESVNLLEFVKFEFLTLSAISDFVERSIDFFAEISWGVWRAIMNRLLPVTTSVSVDSRYAIGAKTLSLRPNTQTILPYHPTSPFDGIIAYLTKKYRGNVHDRNIVRISSSVVEGIRPDQAAKTVADLSDVESRFVSADGGDRWVCYDFRNMRIVPTHYSLRSGPSGAFLLSWLVEGSEDGSRWFELDRRENIDDINGNSKAATFPLAGTHALRFVRVKQIGKNGRGIDCFALSAFELFGSLCE
jgi:hypothetical protein